MRRLLLIATDYPPLAGTNTQRVQSFVRHLPAFGWQASVITRAVEDLPLIDPAELAWSEANDRVTRVADPDPFAWLRRHRGLRPEEVVVPDNKEGGLGASAYGPKYRLSPLRSLAGVPSRVLKIALRWLAYHPDALRLWAERAANAALKLHANEPFAALLTSHPAYSTHMAGLGIKRRTGLPWVADFRDLWFDRPYRQYLSSWHKWRDGALERAVVTECDALVVASPRWIETLAGRYGEISRSKIHVITNGFESASESCGSQSAQAALVSTRRLRFVLTGAMHAPESPAPFLAALAAIRREEPEIVSGVEVRLIGYAGDELARLKAIVAEGDLGDNVWFLGPRPHQVCIDEQRDADVLLLFSAQGHRDTISGKSFEYMATGKPILAFISPEGAQSDILRPARTATIIPYGDASEAFAVLHSVLRGDAQTMCNPDWNYIGQFERRVLVRKLANLLFNVTGDRGMALRDSAPRFAD